MNWDFAGPVEIKLEPHEQAALWTLVLTVLFVILGLTYLAAINYADILELVELAKKGKANLSQKIRGIWLPATTVLLGASLLWNQEHVPLGEHVLTQLGVYLFLILLLASIIGGILLRLEISRLEKRKGWKKKINKTRKT